ncbi:MAG: M28 family peptidase [Spirochaetia bacterium]|nr:M28 family peptidase [Spirochaetia bacterium]
MKCEEKLRNHVEQLCMYEKGRHHSVAGSLEHARSYIGEALRASCGRVRYHDWTVNGVGRKNIIGSGNSDAMPRVIVEAHYDTVPGTPGADDNASSVATLLCLSEQLGKAGLAVEFAVIDAEEPPYFGTKHMGAYHYSQELEGSDTMVIVLEMLGFYTETGSAGLVPANLVQFENRVEVESIVAVYPQAQAKARAFGQLMADSCALKTHTVATRERSLMAYCDAYHYLDAGLQTVLVTDTGMLRNPYYHSRFDSADTLDFEKMGQVLNGLSSAISSFLELPGGEHH